MSSIGERIRLLRMQHGYSQIDLAELLETSNANVSNWERGSRKPTAKTILALAKLFSISTDYILNGVETNYLVQSRLSYDGLPDEVVRQYGKTEQIAATSTVYYVPVVYITSTGNKLFDYQTVIDEYRPSSRPRESCIFVKETAQLWGLSQPGDAFVLVKRTDTCPNGSLGAFIVVLEPASKKLVIGRCYQKDDIVVIAPRIETDTPVIIKRDAVLCLGQVSGVELEADLA